MTNPIEQSKAAASSNQYIRKQYRPRTKAVAPKRVYKKKAYAPRTYKARSMVQAQNLRRQYIKVEDCTSMYLMSLLDPTSEESRGACIPSGFPMPSQKARSVSRGTFNLGTTGDGYIMLRPLIVNDIGALIFTGSASVGNAGTPLGSFTNLGSDNFAKLPFSLAQVVTNGEAAGRVVSACVRVRYAGTESSRAGLISTCEHPDHGTMSTFSSNDINQFESAYRERPSGDGQWAQVNWSGPCQPQEVEYLNTANVSNLLSTNTAVMSICINGGAPSASYEYEAWINVEYIGRITQGRTTNKVDEQGYGNVLECVKSVAGTKALTPDAAPSVLTRFGNAVIDNMPQILGTVNKGIEAFSPGSMLGQAYKHIYGQNPRRQTLTY